MKARGVPAGCVLSVPQVLREEQKSVRGFVEELAAQTSDGAPLRITRAGFRLDDRYPLPAPPPVLGHDTERWLRALGYNDGEICALQGSE